MPSCLRELRSDMNVVEVVQEKTEVSCDDFVTTGESPEDIKTLEQIATEIKEDVVHTSIQIQESDVAVILQEETIEPQVEVAKATETVVATPTSKLVGRKRKF